MIDAIMCRDTATTFSHFFSPVQNAILHSMKILLFLPLLLVAWYIIDRTGLWLHKLNAGEHSNSKEDLEPSLKNLEYALSAVGRIQSTLNACKGDGTIQGLGDALKEYIHGTMMIGEDPNVCSLILGINHHGDDVMVAKAIGDEYRNKALNHDLVAEMMRRKSSAPTEYAQCAWSLAIKLCELKHLIA